MNIAFKVFNLSLVFLKEKCCNLLYYYGARYYDPRVSQFLGVDPLADKFTGWSSYMYAFNNPIKFNDPTGMGPENGPGDPKKKSTLVKDPGSKMRELMPSESALEMMEQSIEILNGAFYVKVKADSKIGVGISGQLGPADVDLEAYILKFEIGEDCEGSECSMSGRIKYVGVEGSGKMGSGSGKMGTHLATLEYSEEGFGGELFPVPFLNGSWGENGLEFNADNSMKLGIGIKYGPAKVKVGIDFYKLYEGAREGIEGGMEYFTDQLRKMFTDD